MYKTIQQALDWTRMYLWLGCVVLGHEGVPARHHQPHHGVAVDRAVGGGEILLL